MVLGILLVLLLLVKHMSHIHPGPSHILPRLTYISPGVSHIPISYFLLTRCTKIHCIVVYNFTWILTNDHVYQVYHFMPCLLFSPLILTSSEFQIFGNCDKYMEYRPWQFREPRNKTPLPTIMNSRNIPREIFQTSLGPGPQAAFAGPRDVWNISLGMFLSSIIEQYLTRLRLVKYCR